MPGWWALSLRVVAPGGGGGRLCYGPDAQRGLVLHRLLALCIGVPFFGLLVTVELQ